MPRPPRPQIADGFYHVTSRGVRKTPIFIDDDDRNELLRLLAITVSRYGWECLGYCLMGNHFHLVVRTLAPSISRGMQWLNSRYCAYFNDRYGLKGHVLERRFWSGLIESQERLDNTIRYVLWNPVRAGLCRHPDEWRWSSYRATAGRALVPRCLAATRVQQRFDLNPARGAELFVEFVANASKRDMSGV
jgi:putative transposase